MIESPAPQTRAPSVPDQAPAASHPDTCRMAFSYVLPLRISDGPDAAAIRAELTAYLTRLAGWCDDLVIVDGSSPEVFAANRASWEGVGRHVEPDPRHSALMGKVPGVLTGLDLVRHEAVVIADDDVRYERGELERVLQLLARHHAVRPQNYFDPLPWHAVWDSARTLLNRAIGADFPGTLAVRRSAMAATGGYDGDVLFENLELLRTIEAHGGLVASPLDLYVRRLPPATRHFLGQRTRQAYDDFAIPLRMTVWLSTVPLLLAAAARRRPVIPLGLLVGSISLAECGRRRAGGARVFSPMASAVAPAWLLERGVCAWLAVLQRMRFGGVRYGNSVIAVAAHSRRTLRRRAARSGAAGSTASLSGLRLDLEPDRSA